MQIVWSAVDQQSENNNSKGGPLTIDRGQGEGEGGGGAEAEEASDEESGGGRERWCRVANWCKCSVSVHESLI
jgi:hypothetical protein